MTTIEKVWVAGLLAVGLWGCAESDDGSDAAHTDAGTKLGGEQTDADGGSDRDVRRYVGEVDGTDIRVAILSDAQHVRLFFCGGERDVGGDTHWFNLTHDAAEVQGEEADFGLNALLAPAAVSGEYRVGDQRHRFSSRLVAPGTLSGLFEGTGECGRLGLIVSQSTPGGAIRAQGACVGPGHAPEQVNPILPIAAEGGRIRVQAPGGDGTLLLTAAELTPL